MLLSTEAASGRGLGRLSMHLEIQCGSLSVTVYKTRPLQRLFGTRKRLTVKMSNQLSLHQAQAQTETYRLLCSACVQAWCSPRQPHRCPGGSPSSFSGCWEPVISFIILDSSRDLGLPPWPSCRFSFFYLSVTPRCFLIPLCSLLPQGLFTGYS